MNTEKGGIAKTATSNLVRMNGQPFSETSSYTTAPVPERIWRKRNRWRKRHGKQRRRRFAGRNFHHFLRPKSLGGDNSFNNLLLMDIERHNAWHSLFGLMTAEEALALLERAVRAKKHQKIDHTKVA